MRKLAAIVFGFLCFLASNWLFLLVAWGGILHDTVLRLPTTALAVAALVVGMGLWLYAAGAMLWDLG